MTEKEKVLKAIKVLKYTRYSCHALERAQVADSTIKLYEEFLLSHYPMFFERRNSDFSYSILMDDENSLESSIFAPSLDNTKIRTIFLKQFAEYL